MIEYVFRRSRRVRGKVMVGRSYAGRFFDETAQKLVTVALGTPDKEIARKRLRAIVVEKQREKEGLIAPKVQREAAGQPLTKLLEDYRRDLVALERSAVHVRGTTQRIARVFTETGWKRLANVAPDSFVAWRAGVTSSAKTKKEYHASLNAFFNWLVRCGRMERNPLAAVPMVETRGNQVRQSRAFTLEELRSLLAVAGKRAVAYQVLLYTGARKAEVRALVWGDVHFDEGAPFVCIRDSTTKDKEKRAIPLHAMLAKRLLAIRPSDWTQDGSIFFGWFPLYETLRRDLERAGIAHKDELGHVVHFHSFRKTWQTLGVRFGINQRSAQEILGHSDPSLTAKAYTDVAGLQLHDEIAKLPWLENGAQLGTQNSGPKGHLVAFPGTEGRAGKSPNPSQVSLPEPSRHSLSPGDTGGKWWWVMDSNHRRAVPN